MFILDLTHLGVISVVEQDTAGEHTWAVEASNGTSHWILSELPTLNEATSLQRQIFIALATGQAAMNLNANRKSSVE